MRSAASSAEWDDVAHREIRYSRIVHVAHGVNTLQSRPESEQTIPRSLCRFGKVIHSLQYAAFAPFRVDLQNFAYCDFPAGPEQIASFR
jgi:hypothetical protein